MPTRVSQLLANAVRSLRSLCLGALVFGSNCVAQAPPAPDQDLPAPVRGLEIRDTRGEIVPGDLSFVDSDNQPVTLSRVLSRGKPAVVVMQYFRCPLLCPQVRQDAIRAFNGLKGMTIGSEFDAVFVSFDPRDDATAARRLKGEALIEYERPQTMEVSNGLWFLTGPATSTWKLADTLGFGFRYMEESDEFSHGSALYVLTADGRVSRVLTGLGFESDTLRLALVEAGEGKIGTVFDRFTLWCFHWDPSAGAYSLQAMRVVQIGALATLAGLGTLLGRYFILESRRRRGPRPGAPSTGTTDHPLGHTA